MGRQAKRRATQRKAESREGQQQGETSIGEEAVPEVAGKAAGRWRDLRRRAEVDARTKLVWDLWQVNETVKSMGVDEARQHLYRLELQSSVCGGRVDQRMRGQQKVDQVDRQNVSLCGEMSNAGHWMAIFMRLMNFVSIIEISTRLKPYGITVMATE